MGILPKCETLHENIIAIIMEHLQQYVPLETETNTINIEGLEKNKFTLICFTIYCLEVTCLLLNVLEEASMSGVTHSEGRNALKG